MHKCVELFVNHYAPDRDYPIHHRLTVALMVGLPRVWDDLEDRRYSISETAKLIEDNLTVKQMDEIM